MTKKGWLLVFGLGILVLVVGLGFLLKMNLDKKGTLETYFDRGVPVIDISLNDINVEKLDNSSKEIKYGGNGLKIYDDHKNSEYNDVEIKVRGNSTQAQDKKPYQIKFSEKVDLLGMGKARKWCLLANAMDTTNLRTSTAFKLEEMLDMKSRFEGKFVELYIDGDYRGLYYLTRTVEIARDVVNLRNPKGLLVELDNIHNELEKGYKTKNGDLLVVKGIVRGDQKEEAMADFLCDYNELEIAVAKKEYKHVAELIDVESFAQYFLLSEFTVNPDAYWTSFFMYKDGPEDKIHAGPGWDFDLAFANRNWGNWMGEEFYSPRKSMIRKGEILPKEAYEEIGLDWYETSSNLSRIIFDLMEIPEFKDEVTKIFRERMSGREQEFLSDGWRKVGKIYDAAIANAGKWGGKDFDKAVNEMFEWIEKRFEFFEEEYGDGNVDSLRIL